MHRRVLFFRRVYEYGRGICEKLFCLFTGAVLFSYLAPQESYRKYFRFFVSALMIAVLMKPVLGIMQKDVRDEAMLQLDSIAEQLEENQYEGKGEDVFEWFLEREGVDYKAFENKE